MNNFIGLIDNSLVELENFILKSKYYTGNEEIITYTKKVLLLLKDEFQKHPNNINERVLRAMHDIGMSAYKEFESTPMGSAIEDIVEVLYDKMPNYANLEPLRMDFGKGYPI